MTSSDESPVAEQAEQTEQTEQAEQAERADHSAASRFAVLSFASGLVLCCPGTGLLAILAGITSLVLLRLKPEPDARWRKYAFGGMALGTVTLVALVSLWSIGSERWDRELRLLLTGPNNALFALQTDDLDGFRAEFAGDGARIDPDAFASLRKRIQDELGTFDACRSTLTEPPDLPEPPPWSLGGYVATFSHLEKGAWTGGIDATIGIDREPSGRLRMTWFLLEGEGPDGVAVRIRHPHQADMEVDGE